MPGIQTHQSTADGHNITTLLDNIKTLVMVTLNTCVSEHSEQPAALSAQTGARLQPLDCSYSRVPSSLEVSVSPGAAATGLRLGTEISKPVHECKLSSIICKYCMIKMTLKGEVCEKSRNLDRTSVATQSNQS